MAAIAMHVETTPDPAVLRWVVRGEAVAGPAVIETVELADELPTAWIDALATGLITQVLVGDGELRVTATDPGTWRKLAPRLQTTLTEHLSAGRTIHCTTPARSDEQLAQAVQKLLDGPLRTYVASHGGRIELESVQDAVVTVRLIGACQGCASAGQTLREGIEQQLRSEYPEIVGVRSVEGSSVTSSGRRLLPFVS